MSALPDEKEQQEEGRHLDSARCARAAAADEHQEVMHGQRLRLELADVQAVEARRARHCRAEQPRQQFVAQAHAAERGRVAPLVEQDRHHAAEQQHRRTPQRDARMDGPGPAALVAAELVEHGKAQTADDHRQHDRHQYHRVRGEAHQAVVIGRKAGVVERRYRVEKPVPECLGPGQVIAQAKMQGEDRRHDQFDAQGNQQDQPQHARDVPEPERACLLLRDQTAAQLQPSLDHQPEQRRATHDAQAADLEQQQNHALPEKRPIHGRVLHDEPRNTDRRHGGEQRRQQRCLTRPGRGRRKRQQRRAQQSCDEKGERNETSRSAGSIV